MKHVTGAGEASHSTDNMTPATSLAQEGHFPGDGTAPHRVTFRPASLDKSRDGGLELSTLAPSSYSREGTPKLAPLAVATGGAESVGDNGKTVVFWRGPHADESQLRERTETTEIRRFASKLVSTHGIAAGLVAQAISRMGTDPQKLPDFMKALASEQYGLSATRIEEIAGGKASVDDIASGAPVRARDEAVTALAEKLHYSLSMDDADIDAFVSELVERMVRIDTLMNKLKAEGLDDAQIGMVLNAPGEKTTTVEAFVSALQSKHGFDNAQANKIRSALHTVDDIMKPLWTKRLADAFVKLNTDSVEDGTHQQHADSEMLLKAAALTSTSYSPATGMSSLFWQQVIDATTRRINEYPQSTRDRVRASLLGDPEERPSLFAQPPELAELYRRRRFASNAYRDALGIAAARGGQAIGGGGRSAGNQDMRVDELIGWQRQAREDAKREMAKLVEERSKGKGKAEDSGAAGNAETTAAPAYMGISTVPWRELPAASLTKKLAGIGLSISPDHAMVPRKFEIGNDADINDLHAQLTHSMSQFCVIEKIGREDSSSETMVVFVKNDARLWHRMPYTGNAFNHHTRSLGQAQDTEPQKGNLVDKTPSPSSGVPRFREGAAENKDMLDISGRTGSPRGEGHRSGDVLRYFLDGHFASVLGQGMDKAQVVVWLPYSSKPTTHREALRYLGFYVPYHHADQADLAKLMQEIGGRANRVEVVAGDDRMASGECDRGTGKVATITLQDGSRCVLAWRRGEPDRAIVIGVKPRSDASFQGMKAGHILDGKPSDFWNRMGGADAAIAKADVVFIEPFRETAFFTDAQAEGKSAESVHDHMLQVAYSLGLRRGALSSFDHFARVFSLMHPAARFANYSMDNPLLPALLDQTTENILIEYNVADENGQLTTFRYCFVAPGKDGGAHAAGLPMMDNVELFTGPPSALLRTLSSENPGVESIRVLATGPLSQPHKVPRKTPAHIREAYGWLAYAGLPVDPQDKEQRRKFATFIYQNYGPAEDITIDMYAAYVGALNAERPENDRIRIVRRWHERRPLAVNTDAPGAIVQYYRQDGILNTIAIFVDENGIRWFKDDEDRVHLAEELGRLADRQDWYAYDIVDVLQFEHPSLAFWRREHDTPMQASEPADVSMGSAISTDSEIDAADDTDDEVQPQVSAALKKRKRDAVEEEPESRPSKRAFTS
jgi:hypothetical protein